MDFIKKIKSLVSDESSPFLKGQNTNHEGAER